MYKWCFVPAFAFAVACSPGSIHNPDEDLVYRGSAAGSSSTWLPPAAGSAAPSGGTYTPAPVSAPTAESHQAAVDNTTTTTTPYAAAAGSSATATAGRASGASAGSYAAAGGRGGAAGGSSRRGSAGAGAGGHGGQGGAGSGSGSGSGSGGAVAASGGGEIGSGDIAHPVDGPAPTDAAKLKGAPFVLVKNWDFGENGNIRDIHDLNSEFYYQDQWGTIANGSNYGAVIVAPSADLAVSASGLGLPNDRQPVEDPARPTREWTSDTLKAHVRPLSASQQTVTVSKHDAGCGSFTAKWTLPSGGALLGKDLVWETRVRMPVEQAGYWMALWTAGKQWDKGAEMDVLESFGAPATPGNAFHTNSVGGSDTIDFSAWPEGLDKGGVPSTDRDLRQWHIWTWVYLKDDSYVVYYDGYQVQSGKIHWTLGGTSSGTKIDMSFLFDFGWGHTQISDVNISLPASKLPITYEIDYSRVYMR